MDEVPEFVIGEKIRIKPYTFYQGKDLGGETGTIVSTKSYILVKMWNGTEEQVYKFLRYEIESIDNNFLDIQLELELGDDHRKD